MSELPTGWVDAALGDVAEVVRGVTYGKDDVRGVPKEGLIAVLRANNIRDSGLSFSDLVYVPESCVSTEQRLRRGDIVMAASSGSKAVVGKAAQLHKAWNGSFGAFCYTVRPSGVEPAFIGHFMRSPEYRARVSELSAGVNINNLRRDHVSSQPLALPPLNEQRRIVDKLDAIFERTRAVRARLEAIPAMLDQLRQSILAAAFRGDLTKDWREANLDVEPASVLLERIRAERGGRFDDAPASAWLPSTWAACTFGDLFDFKGGNQPPKSTFHAEGGTGRIRLLQIRDFENDDYAVYLDDNGKWPRCVESDILIARYGASLGRILTGKAGAYNVALVKLLFDRSKIDSGFARFFLESSHFQGPLFLVSRSAQNGFNKDEVLPRPAFLAPIDEQREIARRCHVAFDGLARLALKIQAEGDRFGRLEQAALAKAFRGELVPQDPDDEPASALLKRIRAQRAAEELAKRSRGRPKVAFETKQNSHTNGHADVSTSGEPLDLVVAVLVARGRASSADVQDVTGLDAAAIRPMLKSLERQGKVAVEGKARGTTYRWLG